MDIFMDTLKVLGRIVTILPFMLVIGLYMGKRSVGELPVFDFLVVLVLGSVVGADIADPDINHIHTIVAMVAIALLHQLIIYMKLKNRKIGKLLTFEPTVVIYNGKFLYKNMKKVHYAIDNIGQMLREKSVFTIQDVEIAVVEANGQLSVKLKGDKEWATKEDVGGKITNGQYDVPIILDGELQEEMLKRLGKDKEWVQEQLNNHSIFDMKEVFYGALTPAGKFVYSTKEEGEGTVPPIVH
ncbi:DUF421 domain-containing protein [Halobacillus sp. A5]|uniref:YetF domain-containing protein n=1 Tax=Halobacillus sp. A5 TaxID=2880263 RepID=UPI0020A66E34|nr:DUF421 domain-containing protein [Halobacillus sp. A5]MCP3027299.1 DUF421 domain-containing protein [Halobacillus sp. A5]